LVNDTGNKALESTGDFNRKGFSGKLWCHV